MKVIDATEAKLAASARRLGSIPVNSPAEEEEVFRAFFTSTDEALSKTMKMLESHDSQAPTDEYLQKYRRRAQRRRAIAREVLEASNSSNREKRTQLARQYFGTNPHPDAKLLDQGTFRALGGGR